MVIVCRGTYLLIVWRDEVLSSAPTRTGQKLARIVADKLHPWIVTYFSIRTVFQISFRGGTLMFHQADSIGGRWKSVTNSAQLSTC